MLRVNLPQQLRTFAFLTLLCVLDFAWSYLAPLARNHFAGRLPSWSLYVLDHVLRLAWMTALWTAFLMRRNRGR